MFLGMVDFQLSPLFPIDLCLKVEYMKDIFNTDLKVTLDGHSKIIIDRLESLNQ